jgi:hypothetical protein
MSCRFNMISSRFNMISSPFNLMPNLTQLDVKSVQHDIKSVQHDIKQFLKHVCSIRLDTKSVQHDIKSVQHDTKFARFACLAARRAAGRAVICLILSPLPRRQGGQDSNSKSIVMLRSPSFVRINSASRSMAYVSLTSRRRFAPPLCDSVFWGFCPPAGGLGFDS